MSSYNMLWTVITCPRCGHCGEMEIQTYFGIRNFIDYKIDDTVQWVPRKIVKNGGRPTDGSLDSEGYAECPVCHKDFFVKVKAHKDVIASVAHDAAKRGYVP